jgi:hypothetical protein
MSFNWEEIGKTVYGILGVGGYRPIQMWDADGTKTMDPADAIRFIATKKSNDPDLASFDVMLVIHDENAASHLDIETPNLTDSKDFDETYSLKKNIQKNIGDKYGLTINWSKFSHNIKSKDADDSTAIQESKDISKVYGTTKSSFQRVGESKLIIRHTDPIDESKQGSRWRKIKGIFIETKLGERFNYPHSHVAGARAIARHLSKDGSFVDTVSEAIKNMSSDYVNLKRAHKTLKKNSLLEEAEIVRDAVTSINKNVKKLSGPRGYANMLESMRTIENLELTPEVERVAKQLAETCNCDEDSDQRESLNVAATHLVKQRNESIKKRYQQLGDRLLDAVNIIKVKNPDAAQKLNGMADSLKSGDQVDLTEIHDIINQSAHSLKESDSALDILTRLQFLSGILK